MTHIPSTLLRAEAYTLVDELSNLPNHYVVLLQFSKWGDHFIIPLLFEDREVAEAFAGELNRFANQYIEVSLKMLFNFHHFGEVVRVFSIYSLIPDIYYMWDSQQVRRNMKPYKLDKHQFLIKL